MWNSTVGLVNGKHRYLTAETFGYKINSNGQVLKKRQQWTIEPFPENLGPDGSVSSAASVSSQTTVLQQVSTNQSHDINDPCILTLNSAPICSSLSSMKSSSNGSSNASDQDTCGEEHENVAIKSHLNKYLAVDSFGNVTCDSEEKTETARFTITICSMSQGRSKEEHIFWAFKNVERGYYLGTTDDGIVCCDAKMPKSRNELWHLHLTPARGASFFALKSLGRRRFARVFQDDVDGGNLHQVQLDATISWGPETLFQFKYYEGGRYSLLSSDCRLLTNEGKCIKWEGADEAIAPPAECLFTLEYHSGFLAFRDSFSHYLAAAGRSSVLRSRSISVSRDELFLFEPAPIQISLKATFNNRWVSIKQGVDLTANQTEISSKYETFQLTYHKLTKNWSIMTHDCNFWTVLHNTNTISVCRPGDYEGLTRGQFRLVWSESDASCSLQFVDTSNQERYVSARKSGQLYLSNGTQQPVHFIMRFQNRRMLNLRPVGGSGFVGFKTATNNKLLEANKTAPDSFAIEYPELPTISSILTGSQSYSATSSQTHQRIPPDVGPKPMSSNSPVQIVNLFNVKLNSIKKGNNILEKQNGNIDNNNRTRVTASSVRSSTEDDIKELDDSIDDNNNNNTINLQTTVHEQTGSEEERNNVESASAPSVASLINSFSTAKLDRVTDDNAPSSKQPTTIRVGSNTARLASAFNGDLQQQNNGSDSSCVITSCSTSSPDPLLSSTHQNRTKNLSNSNMGQSCSDQLAQLECCYLRSICNDKYLIIGDNESSIMCDATNKACAQSWIIELRSHSSIAIRSSDNHSYMQLGTNGTIFLSRCEPSDATLWEF